MREDYESYEESVSSTSADRETMEVEMNKDEEAVETVDLFDFESCLNDLITSSSQESEVTNVEKTRPSKRKKRLASSSYVLNDEF